MEAEFEQVPCGCLAWNFCLLLVKNTGNKQDCLFINATDSLKVLSEKFGTEE